MLDPDLQPLPKVGTLKIVRRSLKGDCPNCGKAKIFQRLLRIEHKCISCGMTLERGDGYFLGPLCINYGLVAIGFVIPILMLGVGGWIPVKLALAVALIGALVLPIFLYRFSWSLWLMIYYVCLPDELHANRSEDSDDLLFEEELRR